MTASYLEPHLGLQNLGEKEKGDGIAVGWQGGQLARSERRGCHPELQRNRTRGTRSRKTQSGLRGKGRLLCELSFREQWVRREGETKDIVGFTDNAP